MPELPRYYAEYGRVYERADDGTEPLVAVTPVTDTNAAARLIAAALNERDRLRTALIGAVELVCLESCGVTGLTCKTPCPEMREAFALVRPAPKEATPDA